MKKIGSLSLASINLWRFHDWETRLPNIISTLQEIQPDIIFTQEIQRDISIDPRNQIEILNEKLGYAHALFARADIKTTRKGVPLPNPVDHGLGVLSRFPFNSEAINLTKAEGDREQRILLKCDFAIEGETHTLANVHFSNSDAWAEAHLKETLSICASRGIESVLAGDFNIRKLSNYKDLYATSYTSSADQFEYVSYPEDGVSYDHVLIPRKYRFAEFECRSEYVSDHKMLVAKLNFE